MSVLKSKVTNEFHKRKIREFLKEELNLSSRFIKSAAIEKRIKVNGIAVKMNYVLDGNEEVEVNLSKEESQNIEPENIPLDGVYEDEDILVLNKAPFMVVHPTKSHQTGTLANGILYYFKETNQQCIVRLVSRLDMNTSGLIIIGKNQYAHMMLSSEMKTDKFQKRYLAIVHGNLKQKEGTINAPIYRESLDSIKRIVDPRGQESITHYKVIKSFKNADLVECLLETGRTHQIRVHFAYLGHSLLSDTLYGVSSPLINRQALHAYEVEFIHPITKQKVKYIADIPDDFKNILKKT